MKWKGAMTPDYRDDNGKSGRKKQQAERMVFFLENDGRPLGQ